MSACIVTKENTLTFFFLAKRENASNIFKSHLMDLHQVLPQNSTLQFDPKYTNLLESCCSAQLTTTDILFSTPLQLAQKCHRSITEISEFITKLKNELLKGVKELNPDKKDEYEGFGFIITGIQKLDDQLNGGLPTGNVIEISGESSTGKSHFLMQLCLTVQLPIKYGGLSKKAVYISTESGLETRRLNDIIKGLKKKYSSEIENFSLSTDNIFCITCTDLETQDHILNYQLPVMLSKQGHDIGLIIIDSVTSNYRSEYEMNILKQRSKRSKDLIQLNLNLSNISKLYKLSIVVSNQVSDKTFPDLTLKDISSSSSSHSPSQTQSQPQTDKNDSLTYDYQLGWLSGWDKEAIKYSQLQIQAPLTDEDLANNKDYTKIPALGLLWTNCINMRIILRKFPVTKRDRNHDLEDSHYRRFVSVIFGPYKDFNNDNPIEFRITKGGLS